MNERRNFPRSKVLIGGKLISPDMSCSVDIAIRDLSEDGALVTSAVPVPVPDRVYLWESESGTIIECVVRWRKDGRVFGLYFTDSRGRERRRALIRVATSAGGGARVLEARSYARPQRNLANTVTLKGNGPPAA
jgi:hypothetical protein